MIVAVSLESMPQCFLYILVRVHDALLHCSLAGRNLEGVAPEQRTGSYNCLICFIRPTIVSVLLYPIYFFFASPSPCSALMLPCRPCTHS